LAKVLGGRPWRMSLVEVFGESPSAEIRGWVRWFWLFRSIPDPADVLRGCTNFHGHGQRAGQRPPTTLASKSGKPSIYLHVIMNFFTHLRRHRDEITTRERAWLFLKIRDLLFLLTRWLTITRHLVECRAVRSMRLAGLSADGSIGRLGPGLGNFLTAGNFYTDFDAIANKSLKGPSLVRPALPEDRGMEYLPTKVSVTRAISFTLQWI
jgi:hypothetical protein